MNAGPSNALEMNTHAQGDGACTIFSEALAAHTLGVAETLQRLNVDPCRGLNELDAVRRLEEAGPNELAEAAPMPLWRRFLGQFNDLMIWILIAAAVVAGATGEWTDTIVIAAIVVLNAVLGFLQEARAEQALANLQKLAAPSARVRRDGVLRSIPARLVVPGDVIELESGDYVPSDCRLVQAFGLRVQESALTGESVPADKEADVVLAADAALGDRRNAVYLGTVVAAGKASAVATATGMNTELGRIAGLLESSPAEPTPLQKQLARVGRTLVGVCLGLVILVFLLEIGRGNLLMEAFLLSVSLAVAAIPEGLPAVVTIALAVGLQRMARRNALIRKLPSVETLGSVTVICSDKTGTLTRNEMNVQYVVVGDRRFNVTGAGYEPRGEFCEQIDRQDRQVADPLSDEELKVLLTAAARCNHAQVVPAKNGDHDWRLIGDPTEGAVLVAALKAGLKPNDRDRPILHELPFDSERKVMSVVVAEADGLVLYIKGAPESVLSRSTFERVGARTREMTSSRRQDLTKLSNELAARAMRVLGFGCRAFPKDHCGPFAEEEIVFCGMMGMVDLPRDEAKAAVQTCREAGIRPIMITGDHPQTAIAIARELAIAGERDDVVTGAELERFSEAEWEAAVRRTAVYARVSAEHKLRVVGALKRQGDVVAMTGDGVNDAPAVKAADIGIAMGASGADVTREASAMVLLDDNFASIVNAVEEGRAVYDNIRKFLVYLLSCNAGEMMLMVAASLLGWPAPLATVHLLWINLLTDGLAALALAMEPPEPGIMKRRPRPSRQGMLSVRLGWAILLQGSLIAAVALTAFFLADGGRPEDVPRARSAAFHVLVFSELLRAFAARSQRLSLLQLGFFTNPYLLAAVIFSSALQLTVAHLPVTQNLLEMTAHPLPEWGLLAVLALTPVTLMETFKLVALALRRVRGERKAAKDAAAGSP